ncbi:hypothetical protein HAX54_001712 [Datura stramonium]|uniref:Uncharacterized protein n=1 Tax=Datura stramonium TaxID=4076 RepID=A0ABS8T4W9_DATST|nr:hypothetical protein [Datura stramonium]
MNVRCEKLLSCGFCQRQISSSNASFGFLTAEVQLQPSHAAAPFRYACSVSSQYLPTSLIVDMPTLENLTVDVVVDLAKTLKPHEFVAMLRREVLDSFLPAAAPNLAAPPSSKPSSPTSWSPHPHASPTSFTTPWTIASVSSPSTSSSAPTEPMAVAKSIKAGNYATAIAFQERITLPEDKMGVLRKFG